MNINAIIGIVLMVAIFGGGSVVIAYADRNGNDIQDWNWAPLFQAWVTTIIVGVLIGLASYFLVAGLAP